MLQFIAETLFSQYRRRVLGLLLLQPEGYYHVREIARLTHTIPGTLHKELSRLAKVGILNRKRRRNQLAYRANRNCPVFEELASILRKTSGFADVLAQALADCVAKIDLAFVFGSTARAQDTFESDVDVIMIGTLSFSEAVKQLYPAQKQLGREINPKVFTVEEWQTNVRANDPFILDVLAKPKIFLIGNEHDLTKLTGC